MAPRFTHLDFLDKAQQKPAWIRDMPASQQEQVSASFEIHSKIKKKENNNILKNLVL